MAVIAPNTDLILLKVPLEISDSNQLTFANATAQYNYFHGLTNKLELDKYTYQRKDNTIRVGMLADDLYDYNYVMYRNTNHDSKWYYAFIVGCEYVNDSVTAISIKTDVWQTYQFDLTYKTTFVEREHVNDDTIGLHTVPENLECGEYEIVDLRYAPMYESGTASLDFVPVFCVSQLPTDHVDRTENGRVKGDLGYIGGVFSSMIFFAVTTWAGAKKILEAYENSFESTDSITNVYMIPRCCVNENVTQPTHYHPDGFDINMYPLYNYYESSSYKLQQPSVLAGNYTPVNNKLHTYPYSYFFVTNNAGESVEFKYEDFPFETIDSNTARTISYTKYLVPSASVSGKLLFDNYKEYASTSSYATKLNSYGINYAKVPICAWTTDYYTNWLTQNGVNIGLDVLKAGAALTAGAITGGVGLAVGLAMGVNATASVLQKQQQALMVPPQAKGDINTGDYGFAFSRNIISFYEMSIRPEFARIIDNFFSVYGYKVNTVKIPNITGRTNWNYVKTVGCYIEADIPQEDLAEIKSMFDNGITFWHNPATFADYSQSNGIVV